MTGVLWGKFRLIARTPGRLIATTIICIAFAFFLGQSAFSKVIVPVYSSLPEAEVTMIVDELNSSDSFQYVLESEEMVREKVAEGDVEAGVELEEKDFTLIHISRAENFHLIQQHLKTFYVKKLRDEAVLELAGEQAEVRENLFELSISSYTDENQWVYDANLQSLFGFALFFSIYTVAFSVVEILREKQSGIWDRYILSPTSKFEVYAGNLIYAFLIGYFQIALVFLVFKYGVGIDFYGGFGKTLILIIPYLFTIVAMSIFIAGITKTIGQFNALVPLIGVSFAMLGGAYWPIEVVSSEFLLALSKVIPITYGMELLKGATISGLGYGDLLFPVSILLLMGVAFMGIGIQLIEKRHV